jgi:hypothetical protein
VEAILLRMLSFFEGIKTVDEVMEAF